MLRIQVQPCWDKLEDEIYIFDLPGNTPGDIGHYYTFGENGFTSHATVRGDRGAAWDFKPLMKVNPDFTRELIQAFVQLARDREYKMPDESHMKGKLAATETHLEDMRDIAFRLLPPVIKGIDLDKPKK